MFIEDLLHSIKYRVSQWLKPSPIWFEAHYATGIPLVTWECTLRDENGKCCAEKVDRISVELGNEGNYLIHAKIWFRDEYHWSVVPREVHLQCRNINDSKNTVAIDMILKLTEYGFTEHYGVPYWEYDYCLYKLAV